jgi:serine protease
MTRSHKNTLTLLGIAATVSAVALPMLSSRHKHRVPTSASSNLNQNWVVDLKDDASDSDIRRVELDFGIKLVPNSIEAKDNKVFRFVSGSVNLNALKADPSVEAAEPEIRVQLDESERVRIKSTNAAIGDPTLLGTKPNDPLYPKQWNFRMINTESAWERTRGKGVVVAVIDTGVTRARDFKQTNFTGGYNFVAKTENADDDHGHGTHVAGTVAESTNNNEGGAGIAFEATIMPLKVLSAEGSGTAADIGDAIRWAADHGANVINMSLGSAYPSDVMHNACIYARKKGVTIVCAAGNSGREGVGYPAAFAECIAVSSVGPSGGLAYYSSWGKQVAIAAPGGEMKSRDEFDNGIIQNTVYNGNDDYYAFQGTSMASPHVAAAAALVISQGTKDPAKVKEILQKSATKPKENNPKKYGAGILNVANATAKTEELSEIAQTAPRFKLRHLLAIAFTGLLLCFGGGLRRNLGLRALMAGAIIAGFFVPDALITALGSGSAWNVIAFSALLPAVAILALRNRPGLKVAAAASLGVGFNLFANANNQTLPLFFGVFAQPWAIVNTAVALGLSIWAGWRAAKHFH